MFNKWASDQILLRVSSRYIAKFAKVSSSWDNGESEEGEVLKGQIYKSWVPREDEIWKEKT